MAFNLGAVRLAGFVKFIAAVETHDYATAACEMLDSLWASQVKGRAITLSKMMHSGDWPEYI